RREAVEPNRGIGRRISTRSFDQHFRPDFKANGKEIGFLLVKHIDGVATRSGNHARLGGLAIESGPDWIADHLVHRLGEAVELADVEIDPLHLVVVRLPGDQHDFRLNDARIADHPAPRLDYRFGDAVAEMTAQRLEYRLPISLHRRHVLQIFRWEAAAKIDHLQVDPALRQVAEDRSRRFQRAIPHARIALLRADVKRQAESNEPEPMRMFEHAQRHLPRAAEFAPQGP